MTGKERIAYLDIARGLGMILVVMGHVEYVNPTLRQFISAFHMPLFFLISGILVWEKQEENRSFRELVCRKLRSIMLPYAVFSLLSFVIEGSRIALRGLDEWNIVFRQLFQSICLQGVSTLWFLSALFMSELLFIGIRKRTARGWTILIVAIMVAIVACLNDLEINRYQAYRDSLATELLHDVLSMLLRNVFCVGFVGTGYYVAKYLMPLLNKVWLAFSAMLAWGMVACWVIPMNWGVDLRYMNLGSLPLFLTGAVSGSMTVLFFARLLEATPTAWIKRPFQYYGRNSLIIMVTHMDFRVLYCAIRLTALVQQLENHQSLFCICIIVLVFLIEIPIIWFFNRYFGFLFRKKHKIS